MSGAGMVKKGVFSVKGERNLISLGVDGRGVLSRSY